jgi:hypothetical protein
MISMRAFCAGQVPKRLFWHFYALALVWTPALAYVHRTGLSCSALLAIGLLELHAARRLYESLFTFQYGASEMHLAGK